MLGNAVVFSHFAFDIAPERFDAVDVVVIFYKLFGMIDAVMFVSGEHEAVIAFPFVGVDVRAGFLYKPSNNGHERPSRGIRYDFSIHDAAPLEDAHDGDLGLRAAAPGIAPVTRAEIRLVNFNIPSEFLFLYFLVRCNFSTEYVIIPINGVAVEAELFRRLNRRQFIAKTPQNLFYRPIA